MRYLAFIILPIFFTVPMAVAENDTSLNGPSLYQNLCADCHGKLKKTRVPNRPRGRIVSAIKYLPIMNDLKKLSDEEIDLIVDTLKFN
jgi:mono/diheme cytochrome c family protein